MIRNDILTRAFVVFIIIIASVFSLQITGKLLLEKSKKLKLKQAAPKKQWTDEDSYKAGFVISMILRHNSWAYFFEEAELLLEKNQKLFSKEELKEMNKELKRVSSVLLEMKFNLQGFLKMFDETKIKGIRRYERKFRKEIYEIQLILERIFYKIGKTMDKKSIPNTVL